MYIYLKNYQGFTETLFKLQDVNFFVGDNSTGKSSILNLLGVLHTPKFWSASSFQFNDSFKTTRFDDLLYKNSDEREFTIGIFDNPQLSMYFDMILIKFKEKDSIPVIAEIKYNIEKRTIYATVVNNELNYCFIVEKKNFSNKEAHIKTWISKKVDNSNQQTITFKKSSSINLILSELNRNIFQKNKEITIDNFFSEFIYRSPLGERPKEKYNDAEIEKINNILDLDEKRESLYNFGLNASMFDSIEIGEISKDIYEIDIQYKNIKLSVNNVGFGISQILPFLADILAYKRSVFSMQQPEVHLHPKGQVAFGEFIFNSASIDNNKFIIETHSDYIIDRFRYCVSRNKINLKSQILFFSKQETGDNNICAISITNKGKYEDTDNLMLFRDFFINEAAKLWEI